MDVERELTVFYDGACPRCVRDRARYERLAGKASEAVEWCDITGRDAALRACGIDPHEALLALHVRDAQGRIHRELDAYILLMARTRRLRWLARLIALPGIHHVLSALYRRMVRQRLRRQGRL
jgi:predicted DCC family thiol-disulfide oxidoreductase YuxK